MGHSASLPAALVSLLEISGLAISIADGEQKEYPLLFVNREFERLTGFQRDEVVGRSARLLQSRNTDPKARETIREALRVDQPVTVTLENRRKDGSLFWNDLSLSSVYSHDGYRYLVGILRDVTQREHDHQRMRLAEAVFRNTHDGILVTDANKRIVDTNPAFSKLTGYTQEEALGKKPSLLSSGKHDSGFYQSMFAAVEERGYWSGDIWNTRKDGSQLIENTTISAIRDESGTIVNYIGIFRDITQRRLNQARLERMASYDPLTGLFNRQHFNIMLERQIASLEFTQTGLAVLFLDLDDFKPINDAYGHASGDELLMEISRRLKRLMRANDLTARFGGDEFVIALTGIGTQSKAGKVARKVLKDLTQPYILDNGEHVEVSASIGIAFTNDHKTPSNALIDAADAAMYDAKQLGKNRIAYADVTSGDIEAQDALSRIQAALENGEIELFFQPILDLRMLEVVGFEALARWRHPSKGVLGPEHFIDVITHSTLSLPFGRWLVDQAGRMARRFRDAGHPILISINLSQDQIETGAFIEALSSTRVRYSLEDCSFLVAEVLESTQFHDLELASSLLQEACALGAKIALDDFGTGISSITYASQLPFSTIKIDRMATRHVELRHDRQQFISGIIHMSHAMQRRVLAEGIESQVQLDTLSAMGCDLGQGFHIGKPLSEAQTLKRYLDLGPDSAEGYPLKGLS